MFSRKGIKQQNDFLGPCLSYQYPVLNWRCIVQNDSAQV